MTSWPAVQAASVGQLLAMLAGVQEMPEGVEAVIQEDPGLYAQVLELNSRLAGTSSGALPSLAESLERLGIPMLKGLLLQAVDTLADAHPPSEADNQGLRQARAAARLAGMLATDMDYPHPHEAALSGLLYNPTLLSEVSSVERLAERVDAWGYSSFLGDALRYQHLPTDILEDAATLVRIAAAAHALLYGDENSALADASRLTGLDSEQLAQHREQALAASPATGEAADSPPHLTRCLSQFAAVESALALPHSPRRQRLSHLAGLLRATFGLHHGLLLEATQDEAALTATSLSGDTIPDLALRGQGNHLAARALREGVVQTLTDGYPAASVLDRQLMRWAGARSMLALPLSVGTMPRALLAFSGSEQLRSMADAAPYIDRLLALGMEPETFIPRAINQTTRAEEDWRPFARRVVHEINNPLGIIKNYMAILRVKLGDQPSVDEDLRIIHEELDRVARIARQLVSEEPAPEPAIQELDLNALLEDLIKVAAPGRMAHKQVRLDTRLAPDLPPLRIDRDRAKQLLLNLLLNAIEASPASAQVTVETHRVIGMRKENHLEVLITNSGNPIRPDVMARLFDPLDSSKGQGHAGLGLSIVKSLAMELHANVNCRSYNGLTTFQVMLPQA